MAAAAGHGEAETALRAIMQASEGHGAENELHSKTQPAIERMEPSTDTQRYTQMAASQAT
jgi:hypothetical protein